MGGSEIGYVGSFYHARFFGRNGTWDLAFNCDDSGRFVRPTTTARNNTLAVKHPTWTMSARLPRLGLSASLAFLAVVMFVLLAVVAPLAWLAGGSSGVVAAAVAMLICLAAGASALLLGSLLKAPELVLHRALITMLPRFGIPMGCCMALFTSNRNMVDAGLSVYIVIFFLVMLAVETGLTVADVSADDSKRA